MKAIWIGFFVICCGLARSQNLRFSGDFDRDGRTDEIIRRYLDEIYGSLDFEVNLGTGEKYTLHSDWGSGSTLHSLPLPEGLWGPERARIRSGIMTLFPWEMAPLFRPIAPMAWQISYLQTAQMDSTGPWREHGKFPVTWEDEEPLPQGYVCWESPQIKLGRKFWGSYSGENDSMLAPSIWFQSPSAFSFSGTSNDAVPRLADSSASGWKIWLLPHAAYLTGPKGRLWLFANDAWLTDGPEKLRHASMAQAFFLPNRILLLQRNSGWVNSLWVIDPETGDLGSLRLEKFFPRDYQGENFKISQQSASVFQLSMGDPPFSWEWDASVLNTLPFPR